MIFKKSDSTKKLWGNFYTGDVLTHNRRNESNGSPESILPLANTRPEELKGIQSLSMVHRHTSSHSSLYAKSPWSSSSHAHLALTSPGYDQYTRLSRSVTAWNHDAPPRDTHQMVAYMVSFHPPALKASASGSVTSEACGGTPLQQKGRALSESSDRRGGRGE